MIERAKQKALLQEYQKGRHRIYAIITDKRGRILSEASNSYTKSSPKMLELSEEVGDDTKPFWHAECLAIHRLANPEKAHKITICRINRTGELRNAKPCKICENAIKKTSIKVVEYSL